MPPISPADSKPASSPAPRPATKPDAQPPAADTTDSFAIVGDAIDGAKTLRDLAVKAGHHGVAWMQKANAAYDSSFEGRIRKNFDTWDVNKDDHLSAYEANKALLDKNVKGEDAAAAVALKMTLGSTEDLSNDEIGPENDGLTRADLDEYARRRARGKDGVVKDVEGWYAGARRKIAHQTRELFPEQPSASAVKQGSEGNCHLLAAAASMATHDPDGLKKRVAANADGTYTVKFGDDKVTVDAPTDGEIGLYSSSGKNGLWLPVVDKAYAKKNLEGMPYIIREGVRSESVPPQDLVGGAGTGHGIEVLTGNDTDSDLTMFTRASTTRRKLESAMADKRLVTAGIRKEIPFTDQQEDSTGLPMGHAYTVIGYDRSTDMVTIRNPWGYGEVRSSEGARDGKDDGVFSMTVGDFDDAFSDISYEER